MDFVVFVPPPAPAPSAPPAARGITAVLRTVKQGKNRLLFIVISFADSGEEKRRFRSPFQKPIYKGISVAVKDTNADVNDRYPVPAGG